MEWIHLCGYRGYRAVNGRICPTWSCKRSHIWDSRSSDSAEREYFRVHPTLCSLREVLGATWQDVMGIFPSLLMFCHRVLRNKAIKMPQINWGSRWLIYYLLPSKCPTFSPHSGWAGAEPRSFFHLFSLLPSCWHILTNPHCWCMSERLFVEDLWFSDFCAGNHGSRALSWQF